MKSKTIILYCGLCILAFFVGVFAGITIDFGQEPEQITAHEAGEQIVYTQEEKPTPEPTTTMPPQNKFMLNLAGDSIAVYRVNPDGETTLLLQKDVNVSSLRQEDYENLCSGIFTESETKAREMVEDFIS